MLMETAHWKNYTIFATNNAEYEYRSHLLLLTTNGIQDLYYGSRTEDYQPTDDRYATTDQHSGSTPQSDEDVTFGTTSTPCPISGSRSLFSSGQLPLA